MKNMALECAKVEALYVLCSNLFLREMYEECSCTIMELKSRYNEDEMGMRNLQIDMEQLEFMKGACKSVQRVEQDEILEIPKSQFSIDVEEIRKDIFLAKSSILEFEMEECLNLEALNYYELVFYGDRMLEAYFIDPGLAWLS
jgi:hypothetical protein